MKSQPAAHATGSVIAFAGRRIDAPDAPPRFPLAMTTSVGERIRDFLVRHNASALVGSAACGADLIAQQQAASLGLDRRIILPFPPDRFRESSVTDRPGEWGPQFDEILRQTGATAVRVLDGADDSENAYAAVNAAILEEADSLAGVAPAGAVRPVLAVIAWEGAPRGADDLTADFLTRARARGIHVSEILTNR